MPHYCVPDLEPFQPAEGVEIRVIHGERMTMAFFRVEPGTRIPEHEHPHEQMGTVLQGVMDLVVGGETFTVRAGEAYRVPGNVPHTGFCRERTELLEVFCPIREDFPGVR
jgi:quercetin dioxygenase-like cupin family protein